MGPAAAWPAALILNEYNAVRSDEFLNGGTAEADQDGGQAVDPAFAPRAPGNGGDWFELVVVEDHLDLRGWRLEIREEGAYVETLVFSQADLWADLRAGTLLTVAEEVAEDVSYDPAGGDWWINVTASNEASGLYITATNFPVNNDYWQLTIRDAEGAIAFGPAGEGVSPTTGVGTTEVFKLEDNPSSAIAPQSLCYTDGIASTFGKPNAWANGSFIQDFEALRNGLPVTSVCGGSDPSEQAFEPSHLLQVEITLDPAVWDQLRRQPRSLLDTFGGRCGRQPFVNPFEFHPGTVTVDGQTLENVGIRKKGFFGSIDSVKPSLKVKFDEFVDGQKIYGLDRMTFNNGKQDPTQIDQCIGYQLFRDAGLPAPRCNFAHVTVNGVSKGIYAHVESIKDPFLVRSFGDASGNLYEGNTSDFREDWIGTFEFKNNEDGTDLQALADALQIEDDLAMLAAVGAIVDLDEFIAFWAMEGLIGHWDGYAGNSNNFWLYRNPATGLFEFIPWSLDDILGRDNPLQTPVNTPPAKPAHDDSILVKQLWAIPSIRQDYQDQIDELLATVWDEAAIVAEIDRMELLISEIELAFTGVDPLDLADAIQDSRDWVEGRAQFIVDEWAGGLPELGAALMERHCLELFGTVQFDFETTWGTIDLPEDQLIFTGAVSNVVLPSELPHGLILGNLIPSFAGAFAGIDPQTGLDKAVVRPAIAGLAGSFINTLVFNVGVDLEDFTAGPESFPVADSLVNQVIFVFKAGNAGQLIFAFGVLVNAEMSLDQASMEDGGPISGSLDGELAAWMPVPEPSQTLLQIASFTCVAALARWRLRIGQSLRAVRSARVAPGSSLRPSGVRTTP